MTGIRLASEVVNYLSKNAREQFRRINNFFEKKEPNKGKGKAIQQNAKKEPPFRTERLFFPKIINHIC